MIVKLPNAKIVTFESEQTIESKRELPASRAIEKTQLLKCLSSDVCVRWIDVAVNFNISIL